MKKAIDRLFTYEKVCGKAKYNYTYKLRGFLMKRNYITVSFFFLFLMSVPASSYARHRAPNNTFEKVVKVGCIGGAVAAGSYALYKFSSWLFSTSTEQVISNARSSYQQAKSCSGELLELIEKYRNQEMHYKIYPPRTFDDEAFLYQIADMRYEKESINAYLYTLDRLIRSLRTNSSQARKRVRQLREELFDNPTLRGSITQLEEIVGKIDHLVPRIEFLYELLTKHKNYFVLYEIEAHMLNYYAKELDAAYYHSDDQYYVEKQLDHALLSYYPPHYERYPYVCYAQALGADLQNLSQALSQAHQYSSRYESARTLEMHATWLYELVIGGKEYRFELKQQEQERHEKERLALEKRKAEAREREARAIERKNRLKERELRERERELEHREYCYMHECADCTHADCMTFSIHI